MQQHRHDHGHGEHHGIPLRTYFLTFGGLLVLMILTVAAHYVDLGSTLNVTIALVIAVAKTALIMIFFMHLSISSRLVQIFAVASFLWLMIMLAITVGDYLARGWPPRPTDTYFSAVPAPELVGWQPQGEA